MKLCVVMLSLTFFTAVNAQTKNNKWDARLTINGGTYPFLQNGGELLSLNLFGTDVEESSYGAEILYQTNNKKIQIGFSVLNTRIKQRYGSLLNFGSSSTYDSLVGKQNVIAFMPAFNYSYLIKRNMKLYSETCLGIAVSNHNFYDAKIKRHAINPAFQFTAIGCRFGRKIGGFVELGYGYKGVLQIGISSNF